MKREELVRILSPFTVGSGDGASRDKKDAELITKVDFYMDKLTGAANSADKRDALATSFGLPIGMTPNALLEALNIITDKNGYKEALNNID